MHSIDLRHIEINAVLLLLEHYGGIVVAIAFTLLPLTLTISITKKVYPNFFLTACKMVLLFAPL